MQFIHELYRFVVKDTKLGSWAKYPCLFMLVQLNIFFMQAPLPEENEFFKTLIDAL